MGMRPTVKKKKTTCPHYLQRWGFGHHTQRWVVYSVRVTAERRTETSVLQWGYWVEECRVCFTLTWALFLRWFGYRMRQRERAMSSCPLLESARTPSLSSGAERRGRRSPVTTSRSFGYQTLRSPETITSPCCLPLIPVNIHQSTPSPPNPISPNPPTSPLHSVWALSPAPFRHWRYCQSTGVTCVYWWRENMKRRTTLQQNAQCK